MVTLYMKAPFQERKKYEKRRFIPFVDKSPFNQTF